ncbi:MAG: HAD family hydrolase [Chthoniobacterales bacterium]
MIDIDATITNNKKGSCQISPEYPLNNAIFSVIADFLCARGETLEAVENALHEHVQTNIYWDYPDFLKAFDLPEKEVWERIIAWHNEHLEPYADAVSMVKQLHAAGMPLFIISNNPYSGCLLKLQRAGLATLDGSDYFRKIFGTNVCNGGKWSIDFWKRCLDQTGFAPSQIAVIGDNPKEDGEFPRSLGVETVFLVDRKREIRSETTPEAILVNTLECVPEKLLKVKMNDTSFAC